MTEINKQKSKANRAAITIYRNHKEKQAAENEKNKNQYAYDDKKFDVLVGMLDSELGKIKTQNQNQQVQVQPNQQVQVQPNQSISYPNGVGGYGSINFYVNNSSGNCSRCRGNMCCCSSCPKRYNQYNQYQTIMPQKVDTLPPIVLELKNYTKALQNIVKIEPKDKETEIEMEKVKTETIEKINKTLDKGEKEGTLDKSLIANIRNITNEMAKPAKQNISDNKITEKDNVNSEAKKEKNKEIDDDTRKKEIIKKAFQAHALLLKNKSNFFKKAFNKVANYFFKNNNDEMIYDIVFANMSYPAKRYCKQRNILSNGIIDKNITKNITKEIHKCINEYNKSNDNSYNGYKEQLENEIANLSLQIQEQIKQNFDIEEEAKLNIKNINNKKVQKNLGELQDFNKQLQGATQNLNSKIKTKQSQQQR